jgi:hypothetical protein
VFDDMMNDRVNLVRADGSRVETIPAVVTSKSIVIDDGKLVVNEGDRIERPLPNGVVESYLVLDTGYQNAFHGIPAHYQLRVRKESSLVPDVRSSTVYNLHGANARVNVNSTDQSVNIASGDLAVFRTAAEAVENSDVPTAEKTRLLAELKQLSAEVGKPSYLQRYQRFIAAAADHMTLLAPFIPALTHLLSC